MWIYGNDGGNAAASGNGGTGERTPSKPASKPKAKVSSNKVCGNIASERKCVERTKPSGIV